MLIGPEQRCQLVVGSFLFATVFCGRVLYSSGRSLPVRCTMWPGRMDLAFAMWLIVVIVFSLWLDAETVRALGLFLPTYIRGPQCLDAVHPLWKRETKRNERGKWKINAKLPGHWLRPPFTASELPIPTPGQGRMPGGFVRKWIPGTQHRQGPSPMVPQASQRPLIARSLRFVWHAPLSRSKGGGACWGGHVLTGAPPAASQSARLRSSPPLSANLIRESGQGIGAAYLAVVFFGRAFPRWPVPGHHPLPLLLQSLPPPPLSAPNLAPRTPPPPHPLHNPSMHPCTGCDRGTDSVWLSASHIRHRRRPSPSPPRLLVVHQPRAWMGPSLNPAKDILQSAICNLRPPGRHRSAW